MSYYDALIARWATLTGTTDEKLSAINALMVTLPPMKAIFAPTQIVNVIVYSAIANLNADKQGELGILLSGPTVDASIGSTVREGLNAIFAGSSSTLSHLAALFEPFDKPQAPWWQTPVAQGGGGLKLPVSSSDLVAAGGLV